MESLTAAQARSVALWRQGLLGAPPRIGRPSVQRGRVHAMVRHLGAVQLDTISTLARSHELVAYARHGALDRDSIEEGYWDGTASFEYWSHAACILPMESWPLFSFRRRHFVGRRQHWHEVQDSAVARVLRRMRADGPITTRDLGGAKSSSMWWDWSDAKVAVEWLLSIGTVVCTQRTGWRRVYDLAERAIPQELRAQPGWRTVQGVHGPSDAECLRALVAQSLDVMGVGTLDDIADVHRLGRAPTRRALLEQGAEQVQVQGWDQVAFLSRGAREWLGRGSRPVSPTTSRTALLSPFDSLIWHRPRTQRLFGMEHRLQAGARLLRDARPPSGRAGRPGGSRPRDGPRRRDPDGAARDAGGHPSVDHRRHGCGTARGGHLGGCAGDGGRRGGTRVRPTGAGARSGPVVMASRVRA